MPLPTLGISLNRTGDVSAGHRVTPVEHDPPEPHPGADGISRERSAHARPWAIRRRFIQAEESAHIVAADGHFADHGGTAGRSCHRARAHDGAGRPSWTQRSATGPHVRLRNNSAMRFLYRKKNS